MFCPLERMKTRSYQRGSFVLERLFPKERDFFPVFDEISTCLANAITELLSAIESPEKFESAIENAKQIKIETDRLVRQSVVHLHESFITPFDRVHIFRFVTTLGDIVNRTLLVTQKIGEYGILQMPLESREIILKCGESCAVVRKMVHQLKKIKNPDKTILLCLRIYELTGESTVLSFQSTREVIEREPDIKRMLKIKEINDDLVAIVRKFKSISYLVEEIILEYA